MWSSWMSVDVCMHTPIQAAEVQTTAAAVRMHTGCCESTAAARPYKGPRTVEQDLPREEAQGVVEEDGEAEQQVLVEEEGDHARDAQVGPAPVHQQQRLQEAELRARAASCAAQPVCPTARARATQGSNGCAGSRASLAVDQRDVLQGAGRRPGRVDWDIGRDECVTPRRHHGVTAALRREPGRWRSRCS
jgi:hypothetical protein